MVRNNKIPGGGWMHTIYYKNGKTLVFTDDNEEPPPEYRMPYYGFGSKRNKKIKSVKTDIKYLN